MGPGEKSLKDLEQRSREKFYPHLKEHITVEDFIVNYSWNQLEMKYFVVYDYMKSPEEYEEYENSLPPGYISFRELVCDENSYLERQKRYYKDSSKILLDLLENY